MLEIGRQLRLAVQEVDTAHTRYFDAGAIRFGVESRTIEPDADFMALLPTLYKDAGTTAAPAPAETPGMDAAQFVASGPSIHVFDAADGVEYLRFDLFDNEPHYHYLSPQDPEGYVNRLCVIDTVMVTDLVGFALRALRERLPEMLTFAGAEKLAASLDSSTVASALDEVERLIASLDVAVGAVSGQP